MESDQPKVASPCAQAISATTSASVSTAGSIKNIPNGGPAALLGLGNVAGIDKEKLMPKVGKKKFTYTAKGKAAAKKYAKKTGKKVTKTVRRRKKY